MRAVSPPLVLLLTALLCLGACTRQEKAQPVLAEASEARAHDDERPALHLEGTPFDEEWSRVELVWRAEPAEVALYASLEVPTEQAGVYRAKTGEAIPYSASRLVVYEPLRLTAKAAVELRLLPYDRSTRELGPTSVVKIGQGEELLAYKYAGEGTCYLGYGADVFVGGCPSSDRFHGSGWDGGAPVPAEYNWWVEVEGDQGQGWINVGESEIEPKLVSTMP